jgi:hypothetical protein
VVEDDTQGLGGLGRVLRDVAGDLLGAQLLLVASLGDVPDVELLAPAGSQRHALGLIDHRAGHSHRGGGPPDSGLEQLGGEPGWWGSDTGRAAAGGGRVEAKDGVEVDRPAPLVLGDLGEGDAYQRPQLGLGQPGELGEGPVQVDGGP